MKQLLHNKIFLIGGSVTLAVLLILGICLLTGCFRHKDAVYSSSGSSAEPVFVSAEALVVSSASAEAAAVATNAAVTPEPTAAPTPAPVTASPETPAPTERPKKTKKPSVTKAPADKPAPQEVAEAPAVTEALAPQPLPAPPSSGISYGIDVSKWQGTVDWKKIRAAGKEFAFIKLGGRDVSDLAFLYIDECFSYNIAQASANGLRVGVYFFSQAITTEEAVEEANFIASNIQGYHLNYPIVYDWELRANTRGTAAGLTVQQHVDIAHAFITTLKSHGLDAMVYGSISSPMVKYVLPTLNGTLLWLARYTNDPAILPTYSGKYRIWQYSNTGKVDGIAGNVDLNVEFR